MDKLFVFPKVSDGHCVGRVASFALFGLDIDAKDFLFSAAVVANKKFWKLCPKMIYLWRAFARATPSLFTKPCATVDLQIHRTEYVIIIGQRNAEDDAVEN
jgi:hypothetical protein